MRDERVGRWEGRGRRREGQREGEERRTERSRYDDVAIAMNGVNRDENGGEEGDTKKSESGRDVVERGGAARARRAERERERDSERER